MDDEQAALETPPYNTAYYLWLTLDSAKLETFRVLSDGAKRFVDIVVDLDGCTREFTLTEFAKRLGFDVKESAL